MKKLYNNSSIDRKLSFVVITLVLLALIVSSVFIHLKTYKTFDEIVESNSKEINKQVILNYESHFDEIRDLSKYIELETLKESTASTSNLTQLYSSVDLVNKDITSISLIGLDGNIEITSIDNLNSFSDLNNREWFQKSLQNKDVYFFTVSNSEQIFTGRTEEVIFVTKSVSYYENNVALDGVLIIEINTEKIETIAKQTNLGESGHIIILDDQDKLIFSSNTDCIDSSCDSNIKAGELIIGGEFLTIDDIDMYMSVNTIHGTRWRIATFINAEIVSSSKSEISMVLIYVFVITIIVALAGTAILTRQITKPLNELKEHMMKIEHSEHLYEEVQVTGQKEVVILAHAYNDMIKEIRRLLDRLVTEQNEKRKTELIALQTQINPHFLYNTLDSIVWLSEKEDNEHVIEMVIALSRFFRISISRGKDIIDIASEIQHAKYYLQIQKIRYSNKFEYQFNVSEDILDFTVVKLVLQPLIENAINHGIQTDTTGIIDISAYQKDGFINFEVTNNGYGLTKTQIEEIYYKINSEDHHSVGLKNVAQRIKLYYGDTSGIEITSVLDESTTFKIYYPIQKGDMLT
jgi:two-component system sensor histidine kinase YesM